jgi:hypothetical protein
VGAARGGHLDILKRLVKDASHDTEAVKHTSVMDEAVDGPSEDCARYLASLGVPYPRTVLNRLARRGHIELALELTAAGVAEWKATDVSAAIARDRWDFASRAFAAGAPVSPPQSSSPSARSPATLTGPSS